MMLKLAMIMIASWQPAPARSAMDAFVAAFGTHVRALRQRQGLSQEEVAHRAGLHVTYLSGIERGVRNPALRNIHRLAGALGVRVGELFLFEGAAP